MSNKTDGAIQGILNEVYQAAAKECEYREFHNHGHVGNGHHMAQKILADAEVRIKKRMEGHVILTPQTVDKLREALSDAARLPEGWATAEGPVLRQLVLLLQTAL